MLQSQFNQVQPLGAVQHRILYKQENIEMKKAPLWGAFRGERGICLYLLMLVFTISRKVF
jgi:hypothetical protein